MRVFLYSASRLLKGNSEREVRGFKPRPTQSPPLGGAWDPLVGRGNEQATIWASHQKSLLLPVVRYTKGTAVPIGVNLKLIWLNCWLRHPPWSEFLWLLAKVIFR
jgi:hypothetical protein